MVMSRRRHAVLIGVFAALAFGVSSAVAEPKLRVTDAVLVRPLGQAPAAAYVEVINQGSQEDALIGASSPRADRVSLHRIAAHHGMASMQPIEGGLKIAVGKRVSLAEEGLHFMVEGISGELKSGETFPMDLRFTHAGALRVEFRVIERSRGHAH